MSETNDTPANVCKQEISSQVSKFPSSLQTIYLPNRFRSLYLYNKLHGIVQDSQLHLLLHHQLPLITLIMFIQQSRVHLTMSILKSVTNNRAECI